MLFSSPSLFLPQFINVFVNLNEFYCRFDNIDMSTTLDLISDDLRQMDDTSISIEERDVVKQFKLINPNEATGPDEIRGRTLKCCARQLATPYRELFQISVDQQDCHYAGKQPS